MVGGTRRKLPPMYRVSAIRQISGFRMVSVEAILVLAKTISIKVDIWGDFLRAIEKFFKKKNT